jgi:sec-independent protein translocase protein TatC
MTLTEHLEELRWRIIKSFAAVAACSVLAYQWVDPILNGLTRVLGPLIFLKVTDAFWIRLKIALMVGFLLALPVVLYQLWRFILSALYPHEKKTLLMIIPVSYLLFMGGALFGVAVVLPPAIKFLLSYAGESLQPYISADAYVNFVSMLALALGLSFQFPLVAYLLSLFGLITRQSLARHRKIAVLACYVLSALVTPGPDPISASLLALSTYLLYEISIWFARSEA